MKVLNETCRVISNMQYYIAELQNPYGETRYCFVEKQKGLLNKLTMNYKKSDIPPGMPTDGNPDLLWDMCGIDAQIESEFYLKDKSYEEVLKIYEDFITYKMRNAGYE